MDDSHVFLALFTSRHALQGASYLQRHLHRELLRHMIPEDIPKTFRAALAAVDRNFRHLHPFNSSILDGIEAATVWIDLRTATAYVAQTGACRVVIGGWDTEDTVKVGCCTLTLLALQKSSVVCRVRRFYSCLVADTAMLLSHCGVCVHAESTL